MGLAGWTSTDVLLVYEIMYKSKLLCHCSIYTVCSGVSHMRHSSLSKERHGQD